MSRRRGVNALSSAHKHSSSTAEVCPCGDSKPQLSLRGRALYGGAPFTCWVLIRPLCDRAEGAVNDPATELDVCTGREVCYSSSPPKSCPVTATWEARHAGGCGGKRDQKPNMGLGRLAWCPGCGKGSFQPPSCTVGYLSHPHHLRAVSQHSAVSLGGGV